MENTELQNMQIDENVITYDTPQGAEAFQKPGRYETTGRLIGYLLAGILFGIILVKGEIISWFRMQEMFLLDSFHMYGIIGSAIAVGMVSILIIKATKATTFGHEPIVFYKKIFSWGQIIGGTMFGLGWAFTGACPGPIFAQLGAGFMSVGVTFIFAFLGTWVYGLVRDKLPH